MCVNVWLADEPPHTFNLFQHERSLSLQLCATISYCSLTVLKASCSRWRSTARRWSSCRPPVSRRTPSPWTSTRWRRQSTGPTSSPARSVAPTSTAPTRKYFSNYSQVKWRIQLARRAFLVDRGNGSDYPRVVCLCVTLAPKYIELVTT